MFYSLTGDIVYTDKSSVALSCSGVAFRCFVSQVTLGELQGKTKNVTLFTHLAVKEDALDLYGFYDEDELECFKQLISVTGVGPKAAMAILSILTPDSLALCIASGDVKAITKAQGIGAKIAQRIVLELKDKLVAISRNEETADVISSVSAAGTNKNASEAIEALTMLGYSQTEASVAVSKLDGNMSVEKLITEALKILSGR